MHRPFYIRFSRLLRRYLCASLRYPVPSYYTRNAVPHSLHTGYMLLEWIEPSAGNMLSNTWQAHREDPIRKQNLFRGMARVMLSLARVPQPRIGSFHFNNDGTVALTNRPLTCSTIILENEGAPRVIQSGNTYTCTDSFVSDVLTFHDNRFLSQPNAVYDEEDCRGQMAVKALLRTVSHHYLDRRFRHGPYRIQHTDLHNSNIFVDSEWNLKYLIDLEWVCSLPVEMLAAPYWLTGRAIDQIQGAHLDDFNEVRQQFMDIFQEEERINATGKEHDISLTRIMQNMWQSKGVWFWHCLESVNGMYRLLEDHVCPSYSSGLSSETERIVSLFWCEGSADVVAKKLGDKERYDRELRRLFDRER
jgi:Phosphotransferase enzyme family